MAGLAKRGQSQAVSTAILVAATLVLALALYSYFMGHYSLLNERQLLATAVASTSASVYGIVEASLSGSTGGAAVNCYIVSIMTLGTAEPLRVYFTVLPLSMQAATAEYLVTRDIEVLPVNTLASPPERSVYLFELADSDGDGVVELIGGGGVELADLAPTPSCTDIYEAYALAGADLQYVQERLEKVYISLDFTLASQASGLGVTLPQEVPLWGTLLAPGSKKTLLVVTATPSPVDAASLAVLVKVRDRYYLAEAIDLE